MALIKIKQMKHDLIFLIGFLIFCNAITHQIELLMGFPAEYHYKLFIIFFKLLALSLVDCYLAIDH